MSTVISFADHRTSKTKPVTKPKRKKATRPKNALSPADKEELDSRIGDIERRFTDKYEVRCAVRKDIRERYNVQRYDYISSGQFDDYIEKLNDLSYKSYRLAKLRHVLFHWEYEKIFIDCEFDMNAFIDRVTD